MSLYSCQHQLNNTILDNSQHRHTEKYTVLFSIPNDLNQLLIRHHVFLMMHWQYLFMISSCFSQSYEGKKTLYKIRISQNKVQITLRRYIGRLGSGGMGGGGGGLGCINLHGISREGNSYAEEQEAHVASKLPGNWYSLVWFYRELGHALHIN